MINSGEVRFNLANLLSNEKTSSKVFDRNTEEGLLRIKARHRLLSKSVSPKGQVLASIMYLLLLSYTFVILFGQYFILPRDENEWCIAVQRGYYVNPNHYENPDFDINLCRYERTIWLLFCTLEECDIARRMLYSVLCGAAIGFERKASDRPAGIRTMSLVSLGACIFTISSMRGFQSSTMGWDAARVSAAVPSGVGFLGTGLIWKGTTGEKGTPNEKHEVHGLTTAASVWLSASIGVAAGGRLYVVSAYAVVLVIFVLRAGPHLYFVDDNDYDGAVSSNGSSKSMTSSMDGDGESGDEFDVGSMAMEERFRLLTQGDRNLAANASSMVRKFQPRRRSRVTSTGSLVTSTGGSLWDEITNNVQQQEPYEQPIPPSRHNNATDGSNSRRQQISLRRRTKTRSLDPRMMRDYRPTFLS